MHALLIASSNTHKVVEIREVLRGLPLRITALQELPPLPEIPETGKTFAANARLKALGYARHYDGWVMADDSGLEVEVLDGAPGVYSARWSGRDGKERTPANNRKLLAQLAGLPPEKRRARFVCVIALAQKDGVLFTTEGVCEGVITTAPRGSHGFGYDPLFEVPRYGKTFAELPLETKNTISHRGRALSLFREKLTDYLSR